MQKETYLRCCRKKCFYPLLFVVVLLLLFLCGYSVRDTVLRSHMAIFCDPQTRTRTSENAFRMELLEDVPLKRTRTRTSENAFRMELLEDVSLKRNRTRTSENSSRLELLEDVSLKRMLYEKPNTLKPPRTDVLLVTPWLAPIVWDGSFNIDILNAQFHQRRVRIGLTVFAIKKYTVFMKPLLETAEKFFMMGHKVNYYVFTDRVKEMPNITLADGRQLVVLEVPSYKRWQDVSMRRMEMIRDHSRKRFINEVDYLVCVDADMKFMDEVGVEILSDVFGTLHRAFWGASRTQFPNERRKASAAYIPPDEGDFYYSGSIFGGTVEGVYKLTNFCHHEMLTDKENNIEAIWHDESYLNKYFLYHKPTKVLSAEYHWEDYPGVGTIIKKKRFVLIRKNDIAIRNK